MGKYNNNKMCNLECKNGEFFFPLEKDLGFLINKEQQAFEEKIFSVDQNKSRENDARIKQKPEIQKMKNRSEMIVSEQSINIRKFVLNDSVQQNSNLEKHSNFPVFQHLQKNQKQKCGSKNFLATIRSVYWKHLIHQLGQQFVNNDKDLNQFKVKSWMKKKEFVRLHNNPKFKFIFDALLLTPGNLKKLVEKNSRCKLETLQIFQTKYNIIEKAYINNSFSEKLHSNKLLHKNK